MRMKSTWSLLCRGDEQCVRSNTQTTSSRTPLRVLGAESDSVGHDKRMRREWMYTRKVQNRLDLAEGHLRPDTVRKRGDGDLFPASESFFYSNKHGFSNKMCQN